MSEPVPGPFPSLYKGLHVNKVIGWHTECKCDFQMKLLWLHKKSHQIYFLHRIPHIIKPPKNSVCDVRPFKKKFFTNDRSGPLNFSFKWNVCNFFSFSNVSIFLHADFDKSKIFEKKFHFDILFPSDLFQTISSISPPTQGVGGSKSQHRVLFWCLIAR